MYNYIDERNDFEHFYVQKLGHLDLSLLERFPDFLVIAPSKTGTSWLCDNLRRHPQIWIPEEKEVRYFCTAWHTFDINWYLRRFSPRPEIKNGEASPSYALLPNSVIRIIRGIFPDIKLVFLMRNPIDRAWSHAKHNYAYRRNGFDGYEGPIESVPERKFIEDFTEIGSLYMGDYLKCLRNWRACFPREQFWLDFFDSIRKRPQLFLNEVFSFLGVDSCVDLSEAQVTEKVLPGIEMELPPSLRTYLETIYMPRLVELDDYLKAKFNCSIPETWFAVPVQRPDAFLYIEHYQGFALCVADGTFYAFRGEAPTNGLDMSAQFEHFVASTLDEAKFLVNEWSILPSALPDDQKKSVLAARQTTFRQRILEVITLKNERAPEHVIVFEKDYFGYNLVWFNSRYYGVSVDLGTVDIPTLDAATWRDYLMRNLLVEAETYETLRIVVEQLVPRLVKSDYKSYDIMRFRGAYYAMAKASGEVELGNLNVEQVDNLKQRGLLAVAGTLEAICQAVDEFVPCLIESGYQNYNIVRYRSAFYAMAEALGKVDLGDLSSEQMDTLKQRGLLAIAGDLEATRQAVDELVPCLIESGYRNYNIVRYRGTFYALSVELGPLDLTVQPIPADDERFLMGATLNESRSKIDNFWLWRELQAIKGSRWFRLGQRIRALLGKH